MPFKRVSCKIELLLDLVGNEWKVQGDKFQLSIIKHFWKFKAIPK